MNGKLLIFMVSLTATIGLSGCTSLTCPAEFARPKSRELFCGSTGNVISTGGEVYLTPAQYQEWRRQMTVPYGGSSYSNTPSATMQEPMAPLSPGPVSLVSPQPVSPMNPQPVAPMSPEPMAPMSSEPMAPIPPASTSQTPLKRGSAPEPEMIEG